MGKYSCENCGKSFTQKSHYESHKKRKTPCDTNTNKIKQLEDEMRDLKTTVHSFQNDIYQIVEEAISNKMKQEIKPEVTTKKNGKKLIINNKDAEEKIQKPFLKWVGGKTQIIDNVIDKIPKQINNYHELFLGGGSVLLAVLSLQKQRKLDIKGKIYAYDINDSLIQVYKDIQNNKDILFEHIERYINEYDSIEGTEINRKPSTIDEAKTSKESFYYWIRSKYNTINTHNVEKSALFMIINKLCFRGMYREGPKGYNVPYGHYKTTPTIITKNELDKVSELIQGVIFESSGFETTIKTPVKGDFVYMDPPYAPENEKSFVGYVADGFDLNAHNNLFNGIKKLKEKKIHFAMSNAKVDLVMDNFKECHYKEIVARRAINSKDPGSTTMEVIVYN